jgi:hypothetical protein
MHSKNKVRVIDEMQALLQSCINATRIRNDNIDNFSIIIDTAIKTWHAARSYPESKVQKKLYHLGCKLCIFNEIQGLASDFAREIIMHSSNLSPLWIHEACGHRGYGSLINFGQTSYIPMPKNASSTICAAWVWKTKGLKVKNPHKYYTNPYLNTEQLPSAEQLKNIFAIIRNPYERLASFYNSNITKHGVLVRESSCKNEYLGLSTMPSLSEFVKNFRSYNIVFSTVHHHCLPQCAYINAITEVETKEMINIIPFEGLETWVHRIKDISDYMPESRLMAGKNETYDKDILEIKNSPECTFIDKYYKQDLDVYRRSISRTYI